MSKLLKIRHSDDEVQRKGAVLAVIILGILAATIALTALNVIHGQSEYYRSDAIFLMLVLGLFLINRYGYVILSAIFAVIVTTGAAFFFTGPQVLAETYIIMCVPIFIASFLIVPWAGLVVAALAILGTVISSGGIHLSYLSLLSLVAVSVIVYLLAETLERANRQNRYRAYHDALTGLPNRTLFTDRLQQALDRSERSGGMCAVLFMDLDHFKVVNDSLGHDPGDELLVQVAKRLSGCLRSGDTAARLGGDEFAILLDDINGVRDAIRFAERIAEKLQDPVEVSGQEIVVTTSIGIVLGDDPETEPSALLRNADMAMYGAKSEGKARFKVFNSEMYTQALMRLKLENDLRRAIEQDEFHLLYQPKIALRSGEIAGMEALVRWEHPERGLVGPGEFIPLAEETGLIIPLGEWVLRAACRQAREWQTRYPETSSMAISVNLSARQFQQRDLIQKLERILQEADLDPRSLQLEITESVVAEDIEYAIELLEKLKGIGVQISIDDFGTGYSSLNSLKQFPLDELKIDKTFVDGLGSSERDTAIVQMVIDLAHSGGMRAVGEGTETIGQVVRLREMRCDVAQGYYFSRPVPGEDLAKLFENPPRWLIFRSGLEGYSS